MNYTPEELKEVNNSEINKLVSFHAGRNYGLNDVPNFCNSPSDIMPIAFDSGIGLTRIYGDKKSWYATHDDGDGTHESKININPLRAICELFILMNQGAES